MGRQGGWETSQITRRPPGRTTRASSRRAATVSFMLRRPKETVTASKAASAKGTREKSAATHQAPERAYSTVDTAVPAARSSTFSPGAASRTWRVTSRQRRSKTGGGPGVGGGVAPCPPPHTGGGG